MVLRIAACFSASACMYVLRVGWWRLRLMRHCLRPLQVLGSLCAKARFAPEAAFEMHKQLYKSKLNSLLGKRKITDEEVGIWVDQWACRWAEALAVLLLLLLLLAAPARDPPKRLLSICRRMPALLPCRRRTSSASAAFSASTSRQPTPP
jgi:hypothetical protein